MRPSSSVPPTLRFGVFELDPRAGELRKKGMKIRLQGQPVEILVMLLEQPGATITREELQKKLWPADTFVDFEQGLNNAMNRLRVALDDDAESPHFIETVPRRGYRFIGTVNGMPGNGAEPTTLVEAKLDAGGKPSRDSRIGARLVVVGLLGLTVALLLLGPNVRGWRDRIFMRAPKPQALAVLAEGIQAHRHRISIRPQNLVAFELDTAVGEAPAHIAGPIDAHSALADSRANDLTRHPCASTERQRSRLRVAPITQSHVLGLNGNLAEDLRRPAGLVEQ